MLVYVRVCACVCVCVCVCGCGCGECVHICVYKQRAVNKRGKAGQNTKETYSPMRDLLKRDLLTYKRPTQKRPTHMARIKYIPHQDRW